MANYQLPNDVVRTFQAALASLDNAGSVVPNPGAVFAAASDNPALQVVVNGTDVVANAVGPNAVGINVTFSESGGVPEASFVWVVDIVDDVTPAKVMFNPLAVVTDQPQPVPNQGP